MALLTLTKRFSFEMAHLLPNYNGLCKNLHGHSYKLDVCVSGEPKQETGSADEGMIIDFKDLKNIINLSIIEKVDHSVLLNTNTDFALIEVLKKQQLKVFEVDFRPTTENLLAHFSNLIIPNLPKGITLHCLRLQETEGSFAEIFPGNPLQ